MVATRLLLLPPPFCCNFRNASQSSSLCNIFLHPPLRSLFIPSHRRPKHFSSRRLNFHSESAATSTEVFDNSVGAVEGAAANPHPWPEWVTFVEQMKSMGYFDAVDADTPSAEADERGSGSAAVCTDYNLVKAACLIFAREHFDILKSLSKKDIQAIVESGCPNLHRKAVNSAKRLRAYVRLDEGEVCSGCNLRGSCDRAYVITREDKVAHTVDVVRILLSYAIDPLVLSGGETPLGRHHVESSARRLLSELIELGDTSPDPSLPKPAMKSPIEKERKITDRDRQFLNVEMKRGDWICSKCNFMNFARNLHCLRCEGGGPKRVNFDEVEVKKGDWTCPQCQFMNFARNDNCLRCQELRPKRELAPGDWECPSCQFMNFARNENCLRCQELRPNRELAPGDWECPSCQFMNFARNENCLRCQESRPKREWAPWDWECPSCQFMNFARNKNCLQCQALRPKRELAPGDWECPSCDFLNFRRNIVCLKCNCKRPKDNTA